MRRRNRPRIEPAEGALGTYVGALFIPLALENVLMMYNATAMNVALSAIIRDLHTTLTGVQSVISLYALVIAASLITTSKLGARHGYRRTFILGAEIFVLGALVTALGPNLAFMLVGWSLLQGIGVALMVPTMLSLLTHSLTGTTRTKALSALGTTGGIGAAAGPILGGLITHYLSWRASFLMTAVLTVAVVLLMRRTADPEPRHTRCEQRFDVLGAVLSATGFGLLVVATLLTGQYGLFRARQDFDVFGYTLLHRGGVSPVPVLGVTGLVVLVAFVGWERHLLQRGKDALVRVSVLRNRTIRAGTQILGMQYLVPRGAFFLVPVFVQTTLGFDALRSGFTLLPTTLGVMVAAPIAARLVAGRRMSHRAAQMWSFLFMLAGCVAIAAMFNPHERGTSATGLAFAPGLVLIGLGQGLATTVTDLIQSAPPPDEVSDVTGLSRSASSLGSSVGVALAGALMTTALFYSFEAGAKASTVLTSDQKQLVQATLEQQVQITAASDDQVRAKLGSRGVVGTAANELVRINAQAREQALTFAMGGMAVMCLGGYAVARGLPRVPRGRAT